MCLNPFPESPLDPEIWDRPAYDEEAECTRADEDMKRRKEESSDYGDFLLELCKIVLEVQRGKQS